MAIYKIFVHSFYKSNAGFFLFFFFLFFGTVNGGMLISYHLSLIQSIIDSAMITAGVMILWLLYNVKCIQFCQRVIQSPESGFLMQLHAFGNASQLLVLGVVHLVLYLPVLVYVMVVIGVALQQQQWLLVIVLLAWQLLMLLAGPWVYQHTINSSCREDKNRYRFWLSPKRKAKRFYSYLIQYLVHHKWKAILAIKAFSFLLLYIMFLNGKDTGHDYLVMVFLVIVTAHIKLPFQLVAFMEGNMAFHRNLPIPLWRTVLLYVYTYALLLLPEALFLGIKSWQIFPLSTVLAFYVYGVLTLFLLTAVLYTDAMNMNEYTKVVFGLLFVSVFGLYSANYIILLSAEAIIGTILMCTGYWQYEGNKLE